MDGPSKLETQYLQAVARTSSAGIRRRRHGVLGIALATFVVMVAYYGYIIAADGLPMDGIHAGALGPWLLVTVFALMAYERLTFHQGAVEFHERQQRP